MSGQCAHIWADGTVSRTCNMSIGPMGYDSVIGNWILSRAQLPGNDSSLMRPKAIKPHVAKFFTDSLAIVRERRAHGQKLPVELGSDGGLYPLLTSCLMIQRNLIFTKKDKKRRYTKKIIKYPKGFLRDTSQNRPKSSGLMWFALSLLIPVEIQLVPLSLEGDAIHVQL